MLLSYRKKNKTRSLKQIWLLQYLYYRCNLNSKMHVHTLQKFVFDIICIILYIDLMFLLIFNLSWKLFQYTCKIFFAVLFKEKHLLRVAWKIIQNLMHHFKIYSELISKLLYFMPLFYGYKKKDILTNRLLSFITLRLVSFRMER